MSEVKVITDSAADIPKWIQEKYDDILDIVSLEVLKDDEVYLDLEYPQDVLYEDMKEGIVYTTSQAKLNDFLAKFEYCAKNGIKTLYIGFSSALSGTYNTGMFAIEQIKEKYPDWEYASLDTRNATFGEGLIVYKVLNKIRDGITDIDELIKYAADLADRLYLVAYVGDLKYLVRGGRLSAAAGAIGNALSIKPVIIITDEGTLEVKHKARGQKKAYKKMLEEIVGNLDLKEGNEIATMFTDNPDELHVVEEMIQDEYPSAEFIQARVGSIIGAHIGPGAMGFAFIGKDAK